jgi:hypothetical protein
MAVIWRYEDAEGRDLGASDTFPDRAAAEGWMGDAWPGLLERGIEVVVLFESGEKRYRMGLRET